jgi:hypothetical protein
MPKLLQIAPLVHTIRMRSHLRYSIFMNINTIEKYKIFSLMRIELLEGTNKYAN